MSPIRNDLRDQTRDYARRSSTGTTVNRFYDKLLLTS
jgi:hypothetical protein